MLRTFNTKRRRIGAVLGSVGLMAVLALAVVAPPMAVGQATRTWVSGIGDDVNPCARTAPCRTFAGAISKTAAGGEINCLDPGGFGSLTITKSITIDCRYTEGGVLSAGAGVNGFVINILTTDFVALRGLDFNGAGSAQNGIRIVSGGTVEVEDVAIRGYRATNGTGMSIQPAGALELNILDSSITGNGNGTAGHGILIQPTGAAGSAEVTLTNVHISNNASGLRADTTGNSSAAGVDVTIIDSSAVGNGTHGFAAVAVGSPVDIMIDSTMASFNGTGGSGSGIVASGATALVRVGRSTLTGNIGGTSVLGGAVIESYATNQIDGNVVDGSNTDIPQD